MNDHKRQGQLRRLLIQSAAVALLFFIVACDRTPDVKLSDRYIKLSCAVVLITSADSSEVGTGAFIDSEGTLLTASHVIYQRTFSVDAKGRVLVGLRTGPNNLYLHLPDTTTVQLNISKTTDVDERYATADLAIIRKAVPFATPCHVPLGQASNMAIGESVIAIGHPGASFPAPVLFSGFVNSIYTPLTSVETAEDESGRQEQLFDQHPIIGVQIPVSGGVSGAPLINESDRVVGIVVGEPLPMHVQLQQRAKTFDLGKPLNENDPTQSSLSALTWTVRYFGSVGSAAVIPVDYLTAVHSDPSWEMLKTTPVQWRALTNYSIGPTK